MLKITHNISNQNIILHTKFGNARLNKGYYQITTRKEGNKGKFLHRLIFEDFYGFVPNEYHVHHKDGNPQNNCILNLQLIRISDHHRLHHKNKKWSEQGLLNLSKSRNTSGFFRVTKSYCAECVQGVLWIYRWRENGKSKSISSVDLEVLKKKVIARGLKWCRI